jgi:glutaredoxin
MKLDSMSTICHAGLGLALLLCAAGAGAQVYKWVDQKGVVHYGDAAPPSARNPVQLNSFGGGAAVELPYGLAEAVKANPVTLYTTSQCDGCDQGRALLKQRGVPFAEKTVNSNADQKKLKEAGSQGQLPLLLVGRTKLIGFEALAWRAALSDAAYPAERMLPAAYEYPLAEAAAPPKAPPAADPGAASAAATQPARRPPPADAPPGFQF